MSLTKCRFVTCLNIANDHCYPRVWDNCCKKCLEQYFEFHIGEHWREVIVEK